MSYIAFLDMIGTRAAASISNQEYTDAINDFHNSLMQVSDQYKCNVYGYSDNAYVEIEELGDLIEFFRLLRKILMNNHRYFTAAVDYGSLQAEIKRGKCYTMKFTAPAVIDLYLNQCQFSGIGISLSNRVVEELQACNMKNSFCESVFQKRFADDRERSLERVFDISYDPVILENLEYIISDYVITAVMDERAGRYYITPIITMIKALDKNVILTELNKLVLLISFQTLPETFQNTRINKDYPLLFVFALIDYVLSLRERDREIDAKRICEQIMKMMQNPIFSPKKLIEQLSTIPNEVISNKHKRHFMSIMYNMKVKNL